MKCSKCAYEKFKPDKRFNLYPWLTLKEILKSEKIKQKDLAKNMWYSEKHISWIIKWKVKITVELAYYLEQNLKVSAEFWLNMQNSYDLDKLRNK